MDFTGQLAAVVMVLGLLGGALALLRRKGWLLTGPVRGGRPMAPLELVQKLPLAPQHTLYVIRCADRAFVVASSPAGCSQVASLDWREIQDHQASGAGIR